MSETPRIWVLADDRAGNVSQCLGVAEALGLPFERKDLVYTASAALPNFVMRASFAGLTADSRVHLCAPWPDLVIAAGRRTAPVARRIRELSGGAAFLCQVMHPGDAGAEDFGLVAVPRHDLAAAADNVFPITGAPHRVTPERLAEAAETWRGRFEHLAAPRIALIVGGSTKRRRFTPEMAAELGRTASGMATAAGGSLLVSTSRRTDDEAAAALTAAIKAPAHVFRWGDAGDNPYFGYLAVADAVVVTGDSVSMCSEACAVSAPVYIFAPRRLVSHKHGRLHRELFDLGVARPLADTLEDWSHPPLNAAADIAAELRRRLRLPPHRG